MRTVRIISGPLFHLSRIAAIIATAVAAYAVVVVLLYRSDPSLSWPMEVLENGSFRIFLPFTRKAFLLGDYTSSFLVSNLLTVAFYCLFLWFLSGVFHAFKQQRLFTARGVGQLSRFYITNLAGPLVLLLLLAIFGQEVADIARIVLLHLIIGVFAFFMAAIFKQGLILQEEQDLIF